MNSIRNTSHLCGLEQDETLRTGVLCDFFPPGYIANTRKGIKLSDETLKGIVTEIVYLPRTRHWIARAALGPVDTHGGLLPSIQRQMVTNRTVRDLPRNEYFCPPECFPYNLAGLLIVSDIESGNTDTTIGEALNYRRPNVVSPEQRRMATGIIASFERQLGLAAATICELYSRGELAQSVPTTGIYVNKDDSIRVGPKGGIRK